MRMSVPYTSAIFLALKCLPSKGTEATKEARVMKIAKADMAVRMLSDLSRKNSEVSEFEGCSSLR